MALIRWLGGIRGYNGAKCERHSLIVSVDLRMINRNSAFGSNLDRLKGLRQELILSLLLVNGNIGFVCNI
jgi:hypothetical protein